MNVSSKHRDTKRQRQAGSDPGTPPTGNPAAGEAEPAKPAILPVLPLRDQVLFPRVVSPLVVGRQRSLRAIERALAGDRSILVLTQRDGAEDEPGRQDLFDVGTEAIIGRQLKLPEGRTSILVQGERRVKVRRFRRLSPLIEAEVEPIEEDEDPPNDEDAEADQAELGVVLKLFEECVKLSDKLSDDAYVMAMNTDSPGWLADVIAAALDLPLDRGQELLETFDPRARLTAIHSILDKERDLLRLETRFQSERSQDVDEGQREFFLREQLKAIQEELGETDAQARENAELREHLSEAGMPKEVAERAEKELGRLQVMPPASPETGIIRTYLDWLLAVPWQKRTTDQLDIRRAARLLNAEHYGLKRIKERILEYLAIRKLSPHTRSPIICFVGAPGVGKTSLGQSIARALGRTFVRLSLGGIRDEAEIRGHRRTYIGALPGRIIQAMRQAGTVNPVFMMDEVDKLGMDFRGDPSSALLEVLDPEQNHTFSDHYLEVPYDLSHVMFITTANILDPVPPALQDRMEVIELPGYIETEKVQIAKRFLVPRQLEEHGLQREQARIGVPVIRRIIREYTREAGVRNLERELATVCRKIARNVAEREESANRSTKAGAAAESANGAPLRVRTQDLPTYLGPARFRQELADKHAQVGVATGVYWTPAGGDLAPVEVTLLDGKGKLILTGQLGDVMRESAQAALSFARSRRRWLQLDKDFAEHQDIHMHLPAGGIPKDGPSAGITMATALISALTDREVRHDVAMTGEITLRGRVLPIGGLKEKVLAAHRGGIRTFILPARNRKDLFDVPEDVQKALEIVFVEHMEEVLSIAFPSDGLVTNGPVLAS
ncbi:MAG: endopeptidase La [Dehalococcoidia bacterium]|nr:endopeptidase La [Dehalococcoidia bacterium]